MILTDFSSVLSQSIRLTDTDGQTLILWLVRAGIPCSALKTKVNLSMV